jgi:hypothetical protein
MNLEFRAVVVTACDDEVIPLQERIETVADDADLEEVYDTERAICYMSPAPVLAIICWSRVAINHRHFWTICVRNAPEGLRHEQRCTKMTERDHVKFKVRPSVQGRILAKT